MKSRKFLSWLAVVVVLAAGAFVALRLIEPAASVAQVRRGTALDAVPATVSVRADYTMDLRSEAGGRVQGSSLELGHKVKKGELLLKIDDTDLQIGLEQATNDYNAALRRRGIGSATKLDLEGAKADLANFAKLVEAGQYSTVEFDKRKREVKKLEQKLEIELLDEATAIDSLATTIKTEKRQIEKMSLISPIDGDVMTVSAHIGDLIAPGAPLATLLARARVVEAQVSEENFAGIAAGQRVTVRFLSYGGEQFNATVAQVLPTADPLTQRYTVLLDIEIPPERLVPGLSGEASIVVGEHRNALIIPRRALLGEYVLLVRDGRVWQHKVLRGYQSLNDVEITDGLKEGDLVITDKLDTYRQGDRVRLAPPAEAAFMSSNLRIALRFLVARRRSMLMSLAGIVFGVGFFIVTQAQTSGFEDFFIKTILGTNGALRIEDKFQPTMFAMDVPDEAKPGDTVTVASEGNRKYVDGVEDPARICEAARKFKAVSGISVVLQGPASLETNTSGESVRVYGINLDDHLGVSDLAEQIIRGDLADYRQSPSGALVGSLIAARLRLNVGDSFTMRATGDARRYRVSAIYETGVSDIDRVRIFIHLPEARSLLEKPTGASFIQVNLFDRDEAPAVAAHMESVIRHVVTPWEKREKTWLDVFRALRLSSALTVSTIILVSGLGMFNTLAMLVMEKTKDIAILRSMGYTRGDISRIFVWQGALVLAAGIVLGWAFGALSTLVVSHVPIRIRGIFATDSFVVSWSAWHYAAAAVTAVIVVMAASIIPARRAAKLEPGDVIRGTAQ